MYLLALLLSACSDVGVVKNPVDDDSDGYNADVDCDDAHATVNPDAPEACDGVDNDCDGEIDEDATDGLAWFADIDGDGFGDEGAPATAGCEGLPGHVLVAGDCDDADPAVNPDALEVCDTVDNDCDVLVDEEDPSLADAATWYADTDGDGHGDIAAPTIACEPPDAFVSDATDCDDADATVSPSASEVCDAADTDEDCDGAVDDADDSVDPTGWATGHADADGDGYGDPAAPVTACDLPSGYTSDATDCLDTDASTNPGAAEVCDDGVDNDCDAAVDEGCDEPTELGFCDGANTGDSFNDGSSMGGPGLLVGAQFEASEDMDIGRVEVFTGEGVGTNTVAIWSDAGGEPDVQLASGSWEMSRENAWQGADLDVCVPVTAGESYWMVWAPINGSQSSWEVTGTGTNVTYRPSFDGGASWSGPYSGPMKFRLSCCE